METTTTGIGSYIMGGFVLVIVAIVVIVLMFMFRGFFRFIMKLWILPALALVVVVSGLNLYWGAFILICVIVYGHMYYTYGDFDRPDEEWWQETTKDGIEYMTYNRQLHIFTYAAIIEGAGIVILTLAIIIGSI